MFSEAMFDKAYSSQGGHSSDQAFQAQLAASIPYVDSLKEAYKPKRRFKRTEKLAFASKAAHVQYVLLEYGDKGTAQSATSTEGHSEEEQARAAALQAMAAGMADEEDEEEELDADLVDDEMRSKLAAAGAAGRASKGQVGSLVGMSSDEIAQAKAAYDAQQEQGDLQSRLGLADAHKRQVASLEKQIEAYKQRSEQLRTLEGELQEDVSGLMEELRGMASENENIVGEMETMAGMETEENRENLARLKSLVILNENLKQQEAKFKSQCKKQLGELKGKIANVGNDDGDEEEKKKLAQIEEVYLKDLAKFTRVRQLLAKKNQELSFVQRKIDDVPTRTELVQYERRFVELHDQVPAFSPRVCAVLPAVCVTLSPLLSLPLSYTLLCLGVLQVASKLDEIKKHYNTYNNLTERVEYLEKELALLDSVYAGYGDAMRNNGTKGKFVEEVSRVHSDVEVTCDKVHSNLGTKTTEKTALQDEYNGLMENQRAYFKACKDFQDECTKNEYLMSRKEEAEARAE